MKIIYFEHSLRLAWLRTEIIHQMLTASLTSLSGWCVRYSSAGSVVDLFWR